MDVLFTVIPAVVGVGFVLIGGAVAVSAVRRYRRGRNWPQLEGRVVSVTTETYRSGDDVRSGLVAHYSYRHPQSGEEIHGQSAVPGRSVGGPGAAITLSYDPRDPTRSMLTGGSLVATLVVSLIGTLVLALGVGLLLFLLDGGFAPDF